MNARLTLLAAVAVLALPGCDTGPTAIDGGEQVLQGTVAFGETVSHSLVITSAGGVRFQVESIVADPPLPEGFNPSLGFGLGEPTSEGSCAFSFQGTISLTSNLAFGLQEREYCLVFADNGTFAEDSTRTYSVLVRPSE